MKVKKRRWRSGITVETPVAVAGVRGIEFFTQVEKSQRSVIGVYEGKMTVTASGKKVSVKAGYGTIVEKGKPPITPFRLPEKPVIEKIL